MRRLLFLLFLFPGLCLAQLRIEANRIIYEGKKDVVHFLGNVRVWHNGRYFEAHRITYWPRERKILAEGSCFIKEGNDWIKANRILYDLRAERGIIEEGKVFLSQRHFYVTGKRIKKIGRDRYLLEQATLTSCDDRPPSWKFTAKSLQVKVEGYAKASWPGFRVKGIPLFYLPWAVFPVKTERQTGFLIPSLYISNRYGPVITLPFFWAISENQDATFYLTRHGDGRGRGFKGGVEYRYALNTQNRGEIRAFGLKDRVLEKDRWAIFSRQLHSLPYGIRASLDLNLVSDDDYPSDFEEDIPEETRSEARSKRSLESTLDLRKRWSFGEAALQWNYFQDLTTEEDDSTLHRLPRATFKLFRRKLRGSPLFFDMEAEGVNFFREKGYRGQRLEITPRISWPSRPWGFLKFEPWMRLRSTFYFTDDPGGTYDGFQDRILPEGGFSLSALAIRPYRTPLGEIFHLIEPRLHFDWRPDVPQQQNPRYDSTDRLSPQALFTLELLQRLKGIKDQKEWGYLKLSQPYDIFPGLEPKERLKDLEMEFRLNPGDLLSLSGDLSYNHHEERLSSLNVALSVSYRALNLHGEYRFDRDEEVEGVQLGGRLRVSQNLDLWTSYRYNLKSQYRVETEYGMRYRHQCWEVEISLEDIGASPDGVQRAEWRVLVEITLRGIGSYSLKGGF